MLQAKNLTRKQKELLASKKLNPANWYLIKNLAHKGELPDGDKELIILFYEGYTVYEIAKDMNRTWPDIASRLYKLCLEEAIDGRDWGKKSKMALPNDLWDEDFNRKEVV